MGELVPGSGWVQHGGDLADAERLFADAPRPFIDLSTGINPESYPLPEFEPADFTRLPSRHAMAELEEAAALAYGATDAGHLVAAPGTQILLEILPRLRPSCRVSILGPTYAEHAHCWRKNGHEVAESADFEALSEADVAVIVNPNNPDGRIISRERLIRLAEALSARSGWLVVDEAFADLADPDISLVPELPENAIVLRSFGKTYGLAGIRLGLLVAHHAMTTRMRAALGPWAVSGPAIAVGRVALRDIGWRDAMRTTLVERAAPIDAAFCSAGIVSGGTELFRFIEDARAPALFSALGQSGVYVRRFEARPAALRLGLPRADDMPRVLDAIRSGLSAAAR